MTPIPLMRASEFIHVAESLECSGVSPERVLRRAAVPMWHGRDAEDLIPWHHTHVFLKYATRATGCETFGLRVGEQSAFESLGSFGKLVSRSLTIRHALETFCQEIPKYTSGTRFWLADYHDVLWLCRRPHSNASGGDRENEQYSLMQMIKAIRLGTGPRWLPSEIAVRSGPQPALEDTEALAGAIIHYRRSVTAIAIPRSLLAREIPRHPSRAGASDQEIRHYLDTTAPSLDFAVSVRQLAGTLLREGPPRVEAVAEIAGLPVRSLQRRLHEAGHSYSQLVEQARYLAARDLLRDGDIKITGIALDLGYSDAAHFSRAFRRWTGLTPREFRRQELGA